jgi:hypothetical protein
MNVCGEIEYESRQVGGMVHSDICITHDKWSDDNQFVPGEYAVTPEYRQFLHACLDEWIDKSRGTGIFWVGDPDVRVADYE